MDYKHYIKNGKLILPEGFNSNLYCYNNKITELILPEGFNSYINCDKEVRVYKWNEWLALERDRKINEILDIV